MSEQKYIPLEELDIYIMGMEIGEIVWNTVDKWEYFPKSTVGRQWTEAADSIAANISEGYGRFHFKDKRNFYFNSRGSLSETKTWATKAKNRSLLNEADYSSLYEKLKKLHLALNNHIKALPLK